jgi:NTE family protein
MTTALVLMGGGARTAYQAGVLSGIAQILHQQARAEAAFPFSFPFSILVGSSAGALNAAFLASRATQGMAALPALADFWQGLHSGDVYKVGDAPWLRHSRWLAAASLALQMRRQGCLLDNSPLQRTLQQHVSLPGIAQAIASGALRSLAVTASSYSSGLHWTFYQTAKPQEVAQWSRPGKQAEAQTLGIDHLLASSALPLIFPSVALPTCMGTAFFGDGSMRQTAPLSPAIHLGASHILVIGVNQARAVQALQSRPPEVLSVNKPSLGELGAHLMNTIFYDALQADLDLCSRVNRTLDALPASYRQDLPYRRLEVLCIQPSQSIDQLAQNHAHELPPATRNVLGGVDALRGRGAALASYLMFEPGFVQSLIQLGQQDAWAQADQVRAFFAHQA